MTDQNINPSPSEEPKGEPSTPDSQPQESASLFKDIYNNVADEAFPDEEPKPEKSDEDKDKEPTDEGDEPKDADPAAEGDEPTDEGDPDDPFAGKSKEEIADMYLESQSQIGELANKVGALTNALENQNKASAPTEQPPIHLALANAEPSQIEEQIKLPPSVTGEQVKLFTSLMEAAIRHEMKKVEPVLKVFNQSQSEMEAEKALITKHPEITKYTDKIHEGLRKLYPEGLPEGKSKWSEIEQMYLRLSKADRLAGLKEKQEARRREKLRKSATKKAPTPQAGKPKADFYDKILGEIE